MKTYDLIVIGAGPGGYVAAIRAAQLGQKVALIEKDQVGGTCLNVGCIPSKTLLKHSAVVEEIERANAWGIRTGQVDIDFSALMKRKDAVVQTLISGVQHLLKKNGITLYRGTARVQKNRVVTIGEEQIKTRHLLLATGSRPFIPPIKGLEQVQYLTTDTFFQLTQLPKSLAIIGGGVIAVELAFAMAPLGTKVTLIEVASDLLLTEDPDARKIIRKELKKRKVDIITQAQIVEVKQGHVVLENNEIPFDQLLVAAGRQPNLELAEALRLQKDGKYVAVNERYETSEPQVYAVGDLIGGFQLAHAASAEALVAVHAMHGEAVKPLEQTAIPRCVYTHPEIASFGYSEQEAREAGYDITVSNVPLSGNGKAIAMGDTAGFVKIISNQQYGEILGAVIVGVGATELIGQVLALKHAEGTVEELAAVIQAHPTVSEAIGESANATFQRAIHL
ncbi:dihydrolipoyl dehydrogenase [Bacillus xiapuensis]|uniref:dihydrolipoyl dehydrogenase n=1 Tax=Bacillus xiapuensis TaxID=2014075 RepID=UPI000C24CAA5|nr:dihydrolipoyl dehydrogenase [Bacillus xiapuensis]